MMTHTRTRITNARRGIAMMLVLICLSTATIVTVSYLSSRDNSAQIGLNIADSVSARWAAMSGLEIVAVILAIAYLVLAIRQNILCWAAAIIGCSLYIWIMYSAGLYMESALQVFYIAMAVYGWYAWTHGDRADHGLSVTSWPLIFHVPRAATVCRAV